MVKDYITRLLVVFVGVLFLIYIASLWTGNVTIVQLPLIWYNDIMYIFITLLVVYVSFVYWLYPMDLPRLKRTLFAIGIVMILVGHYVLQDNSATYVFFADITKVIGVVLLILWPAWLLIPEVIKRKRKAAKIEVIEV